MIVLYEHPLSPYAQKIKIALREKELDFEVRTPPGLGAGQEDPELAAASPRGEVPALIHGNTTIFDSTIILDYLEEAFPTPPLLPESPARRARSRQIEEVMDTHYEAINWGLSEIRYFRRATGQLAQTLTAAASDQTRRFQQWLEDLLGEDPWFEGETFGRTDLCVVPYLVGSEAWALGPEPDTKLGIWLTRARERVAVALTLDEASAAAAVMLGAAKMVKSGRMKRQYRDHRLEWMIRNGGLEVVTRGLEAGDIRFTDFP